MYVFSISLFISGSALEALSKITERLKAQLENIIAPLEEIRDTLKDIWEGGDE